MSDDERLLENLMLMDMRQRMFAMPPVSKAQNALMQAAAADPKVAKRTGVPQRVAKEFTANLKPGSVKKLPARKEKR
jgi:hypothetical protein